MKIDSNFILRLSRRRNVLFTTLYALYVIWLPTEESYTEVELLRFRAHWPAPHTPTRSVLWSSTRSALLPTRSKPFLWRWLRTPDYLRSTPSRNPRLVRFQRTTRAWESTAWTSALPVSRCYFYSSSLKFQWDCWTKNIIRIFQIWKCRTLSSRWRASSNRSC